MPYPSISARFAQRIGTRYTQGASWGRDCPQAEGWDQIGRHYSGTVDWPTQGIDPAFRPDQCRQCKVQYAGEELWGSSGTHPIYDTPDGKLHPGDLHWVDQHHSEGGRGWCPGRWSNCDGLHLHARCPNNNDWDIDSRASNCTLPDDLEHRCWIRHGEPPLIQVDKNGLTCNAGAGSIQAGDYHGFLHEGVFSAG